MRCGDCKHWARGEADYRVNGGPPADGYGSCRAIPFDRTEATAAVYPDDPPSDDDPPIPPELINVKAVALDGSGYFAAIRTREDFGCVLFERAD